MSEEMRALVASYAWPSQAYWRYFELNALRAIPMERPILEIGCGDGCFSSMLFDAIDEAIDINPKAVARARVQGVYRKVRCADAREIQDSERFATVYANCVLEHIPGVVRVLRGCYRALQPGGRLVATVPLPAMNRHLLLRSAAYARYRQEQLAHCTLMDVAEWKTLLESCGFMRIQSYPYLRGKACRFWDSIDVIGCLGRGRYCVATALRPLQRMFPGESRLITKWMERNFARNEIPSEPCAAVVVAAK